MSCSSTWGKKKWSNGSGLTAFWPACPPRSGGNSKGACSNFRGWRLSRFRLLRLAWNDSGATAFLAPGDDGPWPAPRGLLPLRPGHPESHSDRPFAPDIRGDHCTPSTAPPRGPAHEPVLPAGALWAPGSPAASAVPPLELCALSVLKNSIQGKSFAASEFLACRAADALYSTTAKRQTVSPCRGAPHVPPGHYSPPRPSRGCHPHPDSQLGDSPACSRSRSQNLPSANSDA